MSTHAVCLSKRLCSWLSAPSAPPPRENWDGPPPAHNGERVAIWEEELPWLQRAAHGLAVNGAGIQLQQRRIMAECCGLVAVVSAH